MTVYPENKEMGKKLNKKIKAHPPESPPSMGEYSTIPLLGGVPLSGGRVPFVSILKTHGYDKSNPYKRIKNIGAQCIASDSCNNNHEHVEFGFLSSIVTVKAA